MLLLSAYLLAFMVLIHHYSLLSHYYGYIGTVAFGIWFILFAYTHTIALVEMAVMLYRKNWPVLTQFGSVWLVSMIVLYVFNHIFGKMI
ncbi:MAG: hypothetical protein ACRBCI_03560 [Cellvibrionaceae bacterium]